MSKVTPFLLGGIIGAAAAILYAPRAGEQTRALVAEKANALWGEAKDFGAGTSVSASDAYKAAQERGASMFQEFAKNATQQASDLVNGATDRIKSVAGGVPEPAAADTQADDLREKIEAARQRIAAQVIANAQAAGEAPVEAVAEAAEEAVEAAAETTEAVAEAVKEAAEDLAEKIG